MEKMSLMSRPMKSGRAPGFPGVLRLLGLALLALALSQSPARAQAFKTESGRAEFTSSVPLHTFTGTSESLVGLIDLDEKTVDFYIDLTTLETGIGKRDKDMRTTLETDEYPFAEFFGKLVSNFDPSSSAPQPATVRGDFTIHGVTREVEITGTLQNTDGGLKVDAGWDLNLKDYDIEPPSLLIVKVDEVQKIRIEALLKPVSS